MHSSRQCAGRQAQIVLARLVQRHFPDILGTDSQCVVCSKSHTRKRSRYGCEDYGNVHLCVTPALGFTILGYNYFIWEGVCYLMY